MSIELIGNWKKGLAFDVHTLSSTYIGVNEYGHDQWDNTRSEMGQLVYRLKYNGDPAALTEIIRLLDKVKGVDSMDYIVPIPSTNKTRKIQPVLAIAKALGECRGVTVLNDLLVKSAGGRELKNVEDPEERAALLREHIRLSDSDRVNGKNILLVDDLYRSGATLSVATELLYKQGAVKDVFVLTMTKTRSKR